MSYQRKLTRLVTHSRKSLVLLLTIALLATSVRADLFIRDDLADSGAEPNPTIGPIYLSPDIWVLREPLNGWNPYPYTIGSPPPWMVPEPIHEDPDHRSPLSGKPNYVYVRIRNTGSSASLGTERLQLYWASASTGLSWDPAKAGGSFIDNLVGNVLFGSEITKVRKNAATATPTERSAYINAIRQIATNPALSFSPSGGDSYWHTQQEIHRFGPTYRHGSGNPTFVPSVAFLPWHREYINRYEGLLQEANPTVKLLYWGWNPTTGTNHPETGTFNYFTNSFMGASGRTLSAGVPIGPSLFPDLNPLYTTDASVGLSGSPNVVRRMQPSTTIQSDTTILNRVDYDSIISANNFSGELERLSHNASHVFIGGYWGPNSPFNPAMGGDQLFQPYAARDPFFFLLHGKVDELWARWQRKSLLNLDPATTFGSADGDSNIDAFMSPWNGVAFPDGLANDTSGEIEPWTLPGGQRYDKPGSDESVKSPPFYDSAPLTIPVMQPNQELILEIPWYPPSPASFGSVSDPNHVCMIARIETSTLSPFGMTTPETADIGFNTKQNNNIAWRNLSVVDTFPGPFRIVRLLVRNVFRETTMTGLRLGAKLDRRQGGDFFERGIVRVDLGSELLERWRAGGAKGTGFEVLSNGQLVLPRGEAVLEGIQLKPNETFPVRLTFELKRDYRPNKKGERMVYDVVQTGTPRDPKAIVGGQRYEVDVEKIVPVQQGRTWRFLPGSKMLPIRWSSLDFDDSEWYERRLDLGLVDSESCGDAHRAGPATFYFRHTFDVSEPEFMRSLTMRIKRSDGAIAYLNGKEVYRSNLPKSVNGRTLALTAVRGIERNAFFPVKLDPSLLRKGRNVLAVEIHRAAENQGVPTFDLELSANRESAQEAPYIQFTAAASGSLATVGRTATINADALDTDGSVRSVSFVIDGENVKTVEKAPFSVDWRVKSGPHRVTAIVTDNNGLQTRVHTTVTGVANVPPRITVTQPSQHTEISKGDTLVIVARAEDSDGTIQRVDFFLNDSMRFGVPARLIGTARGAPFMITVRDLTERHNMITAVAFDSGGARTAAIPIMVVVRDAGKSKHTQHIPR